ncbi:Uncharacterised protein (plasmid) [Tsukamurella tyrosinosolvens]|uniref:Uncharacterized protein n=1 Tax=Tsukamurella tyrosinosolvens TaxID=57704 RepID=A0A1H4VAY9_TSUTY|nr:hypothetical protein [Tsukamurella tyrosinosolvens]KXO91014.1 hypothetical protein AXK58_21530 [Tsukamurella tyrosinosolvens]SEC78157.1 hypothetical protein SAMN04489793_3186 [Tsukamurella tyrosinosolvens]VEH90602.1 Uncharacterised protein [Tsukamurella tyrosinosolvens]
MPDISMANTVAYAQQGLVTEDGAFLVALVTRDEPGYTPTTYTFRDLDDALDCATTINTRRGFSGDQVREIVASSFRPGR